MSFPVIVVIDHATDCRDAYEQVRHAMVAFTENDEGCAEPTVVDPGEAVAHFVAAPELCDGRAGPERPWPGAASEPLVAAAAAAGIDDAGGDGHAAVEWIRQAVGGYYNGDPESAAFDEESQAFLVLPPFADAMCSGWSLGGSFPNLLPLRRPAPAVVVEPEADEWLQSGAGAVAEPTCVGLGADLEQPYAAQPMTVESEPLHSASAVWRLHADLARHRDIDMARLRERFAVVPCVVIDDEWVDADDRSSPQEVSRSFEVVAAASGDAWVAVLDAHG